jgi:hypothetical protein
MDSTERIPGDDVPDTEADLADVVEQAEPPAAEPVEQALQQREPIVTGDPALAEQEAEDAAEAGDR